MFYVYLHAEGPEPGRCLGSYEEREQAYLRAMQALVDPNNEGNIVEVVSRALYTCGGPAGRLHLKSGRRDW